MWENNENSKEIIKIKESMVKDLNSRSNQIQKRLDDIQIKQNSILKIKSEVHSILNDFNIK